MRFALIIVILRSFCADFGVSLSDGVSTYLDSIGYGIGAKVAKLQNFNQAFQLKGRLSQVNTYYNGNQQAQSRIGPVVQGSFLGADYSYQWMFGSEKNMQQLSISIPVTPTEFKEKLATQRSSRAALEKNLTQLKELAIGEYIRSALEIKLLENIITQANLELALLTRKSNLQNTRRQKLHEARDDNADKLIKKAKDKKASLISELKQAKAFFKQKYAQDNLPIDLPYTFADWPSIIEPNCESKKYSLINSNLHLSYLNDAQSISVDGVVRPATSQLQVGLSMDFGLSPLTIYYEKAKLKYNSMQDCAQITNNFYEKQHRLRELKQMLLADNESENIAPSSKLPAIAHLENIYVEKRRVLVNEESVLKQQLIIMEAFALTGGHTEYWKRYI